MLSSPVTTWMERLFSASHRPTPGPKKLGSGFHYRNTLLVEVNDNATTLKNAKMNTSIARRHESNPEARENCGQLYLGRGVEVSAR